MNVHKDARLTPSGPAFLAERIETGWPARSATAAAGCRSGPRASGWDGIGSGARADITTRSVPKRCLARTEPERATENEMLRRQRMTADRADAGHGALDGLRRAATTGAGLGRLTALDPKPEIVRYERALPGETPCLQANSPAFAPASFSRRIPSSSVNLARFSPTVLLRAGL
jgi:hypothetical protein